MYPCVMIFVCVCVCVRVCVRVRAHESTCTRLFRVRMRLHYTPVLVVAYIAINTT